MMQNDLRHDLHMVPLLTDHMVITPKCRGKMRNALVKGDLSWKVGKGWSEGRKLSFLHWRVRSGFIGRRDQLHGGRIGEAGRWSPETRLFWGCLLYPGLFQSHREVSKRTEHKWMRWTTRVWRRFSTSLLARYVSEESYSVFKQRMMKSDDLRSIEGKVEYLLGVNFNWWWNNHQYLYSYRIWLHPCWFIHLTLNCF